MLIFLFKLLFIYQIVWDAERKKWVNTGEDEEPETEAAPPPKDIDLNKCKIRFLIFILQY